MPRTARLLLDGGCYHILTRGNNQATVFHDSVDFQRYGRLLATYLPEHQIALYHYCLMTNHVHLIIETATAEGLRKAMQGINLSYALAYKKRHGHIGHFWQDRFKSLLIAKDDYLLQCGAYVELNPVRANIVTAPAAYPWSSYRVYAQGHPDPLVTLNPLYEAFGKTVGERQAAYQQFIHQRLPEFPSDWMARRALGPSAFLQELGRQFDYPLIARARGRPVGSKMNRAGRTREK